MLGDVFNLEGNLWSEFQRLQREMDDLFNWGWDEAVSAPSHRARFRPSISARRRKE